MSLFWHLIPSTTIKCGSYYLYVTKEELRLGETRDTANKLKSLNWNLELSGIKSFALSSAGPFSATVQLTWEENKSKILKNPNYAQFSKVF